MTDTWHFLSSASEQPFSYPSVFFVCGAHKYPISTTFYLCAPLMPQLKITSILLLRKFFLFYFQRLYVYREKLTSSCMKHLHLFFNELYRHVVPTLLSRRTCLPSIKIKRIFSTFPDLFLPTTRSRSDKQAFYKRHPYSRFPLRQGDVVSCQRSYNSKNMPHETYCQWTTTVKPVTNLFCINFRL